MAFLSPQLSMGWRAKIGILYPEHGYLDEELWGFAAPGVTPLIARTRVQPNEKLSSLKKFAEDPDNDRTAQGFARIDVDSVAYACTAIGFIRGPGGDVDLNKRMSLASRAPATCTITASVEAMRFLGATKVAVGTPYSDELNDSLRKFLEHHGFQVVNLKGLNIVGNLDGAAVNDVSLQAVRKLAVGVNTVDAEVVYIPCTALRTLEIIESLEEDLGKPVISANQATMWHAQQLAGVNARLEGLGTLFHAASVPVSGAEPKGRASKNASVRSIGLKR